MITYFSTKSNQELNIVLTSPQIILPSTLSSNSVAVAVYSTIIKNGVDTLQSTVVVAPNDVLVIKVTTSLAFSVTTQASLAVNADTWTFPVTTKDDLSLYAKPEYINISPFDGLSFPDGTEYTPRSDLNTIEVLQVATGVVSTVIPLSAPIMVEPTSGLALISLLSYFEDKILFVQKDTKKIINSLQLPTGSLPSCVAHTVDLATNKLYNWVTLSGVNTLIQIDPDDLTIKSTINVGRRPLGVFADKSDNTLWVTNFADNTVSKISYAGVVQATYIVGRGPIEAVVEPTTGDLWVACSTDNKVYVISKTSGTVTSITVGENPWGIKIAGVFAYVTNSFDGTLSKVNTSTEAVSSTFYVGSYPSAVEVDSLGNLWVASVGDSTVLKITNDVVVQTIAVPKSPLSIALDDVGELWVASMYGGKPIRTFSYDYSADRISFLSVIAANRNTLYTSNSATISGLRTDVSLPCSIPNISGFNILKNSVSVGIATTVQNGDQLQLQQVSDNSTAFGITQSIKLAYGNNIAVFSVTTVSALVNPDQFTFVEVANAPVNTSYVSNTVNISGITVGIPVSVTTTLGTLVINGVDSLLSSSIVQAGDTLAIRMLSSSLDDSIATSRISIGNIFEEWSILTEQATPDHLSSLPSIPDVLAAPISYSVTTTFTVSGIAEPVQDPILDPLNPPPIKPPLTALLKISNFLGNLLTVNGVSGTEFEVKNGDSVVVSVMSANAFNNTTTHTVFLNQHPLTFNVVTALDNQPDIVIFQDTMESMPRSESLSTVVTITGMNTGAVAPITVSRGYLIVNGVTFGETATVQLGDSLQWALAPQGPYGGHNVYTMNLNGVTASWTLYNLSLLGSVKDKNIISYDRHPLLLRNWVEEITKGRAFSRSLPVLQRPARVTKLQLSSFIKQTTLTSKALRSEFSVHNLTSSVMLGTRFGKSETNVAVSVILNRQTVLDPAHKELIPRFVGIPKAYALRSQTVANTVTYAKAVSHEKIMLNKYSTKADYLFHTTKPHVWVEESSYNFTLITPTSFTAFSKNFTLITPTPFVTITHNVSSRESPKFEQSFLYSKVKDTTPDYLKTDILSKLTVSRPLLKASTSELLVPHTGVLKGANQNFIGVPLLYVKQVAVTKGDAGKGVTNINHTKRFSDASSAVENGQNIWKFSNVQPMAWGDGTYIWTGNCSTYRPFPISGYFSGG